MLFCLSNNNIVDRRNFLKIAGLGVVGLATCAGDSFNLENLIARPRIEDQPLLSPIYQIGLYGGHNMDSAILSYITLDTWKKKNKGRIIFKQPVKAKKISERRVFNLILNSVLVEGLEPGKDYGYEVEDYGIGGVIKTAHNDDRDFNFLLESDTQCWYGKKTHKPISEAIAEQMLKEDDPRFLINCGDITQRGTLDDWLTNLFPYYGELLPNLPFYAVRGNHDLLGFGFWHVFGKWVKAEGLLGNSKKINYSFDYGHVHFIVLNSNTGCKAGAKKFLENDLKNSNARFNILFYHHPFAINVEDYPLDAVFFGHSHRYVRYRHKATGIPYIIAGGGCDKMEHKYCRNSHEEFEMPVCESYNHYILMQVREGVVHAVVKDKAGVIRDTFEILPKAF